MGKAHDWAGRIIHTIDALSNISTYTYSFIPSTTTGKKVSLETFTDPNGKVSKKYTYADKTLKIINTAGEETTYEYDAFGNLIKITDPNANSRRLVYDLRGNKIKEISALGLVKEYKYDNNGNLILEKNEVDRIEISYDEADRVIKKRYSDGNEKQFTYDDLGRLIGAKDKYSDYVYSYDRAGNLIRRIDNKRNEAIYYTYDKAGNRISMEAKNKKVVYSYDSLHRLTNEVAITIETGNVYNSSPKPTTNLVVSYKYNPMDRLVEKRFSTGVKTIYSYDTIHRLKRIVNYRTLLNPNTSMQSKESLTTSPSSQADNEESLSSGEEEPPSSIFEYSYDKVGNRIEEKEITSGKTNISTFIYDNTYRLAKASYGEGKFEEFSYDKAGNRVKKSSNLDGTNTTITYVYDNDNRLMLEQEASYRISYSYDRAGRLISRHSTKDGALEIFRYDSRDLMIEYVKKKDNTQTITKYTYDVNNLRIEKKGDLKQRVEEDSWVYLDSDDTIRYTYDGKNILFEGSVFYLNNISINGYEAEIQPLRIAVYIKDALGSIRAEVYDRPIEKIRNGLTVKVEFKVFGYTAFGEQIPSSSTQVKKEETRKGIAYTGHYYDDESDLYYARARYYDATLGRFLTPDPIIDPAKRYAPAGLNFYIYGLNSPLNYWDPDGEWINVVIGAIVGAVIGGVSAWLSGGNIYDIILGTISGGVSGALAACGVPVSFSLSTKGLSVGFGITDKISVGVRLQFANSPGGGSFGFYGRVGFNENLGLNAGVDFTSSGNVLFNAGLYVGSNTMNIGANARFSTNEGYEGFGFSSNVNTASDAGGWGGFGGFELNIDKRGQLQSLSFNAGITYMRGMQNPSDAYNPMNFIRSGGGITGVITPGADGRVNIDIRGMVVGDYRATVQKKAIEWVEKNAERMRQEMTEEEQKMLWAENTKAYGGYSTTSPTKEQIAEFEYTTTKGMLIGQQAPAGGEQQTQPMTSAEAYAMALSNPQVSAQMAEGYQYLQEKQEAIQNGTLGQFYKREMLENLTLVTINGREYFATTIDGRQILIGRANIDLDFPGSTDSLRNVRTAISSMTDNAIVGLAKFAEHNPDLRITSLWRHDNNGPHEWGRAIDFAMPENTPVYAAEGGQVVTAGYSQKPGFMIVIQGNDGLTYRYMHNNVLLYQNNQAVNSGANISLSGNTGLSFGPHLHFDVR